MPSLTSLTTIALLAALTLATPFNLPASPNHPHLHPRNTTIPQSSGCAFTRNPNAGGYYSNPPSWPAYVSITIAHKTTPELGSPGQGLRDNLKGECGGLLVNAGWPNTVSSFGTDPQTGLLLGYQAWVLLPASASTYCVQQAIKKAENQDVVCKDLTSHR